MLEGYKTTPEKEINKINQILQNKEFSILYTQRIAFYSALDDTFSFSDFSSYDTSLTSYIKNVIEENTIYEGMESSAVSILKYRFYVESLLALIDNQYFKTNYINDFNSDVIHLKKIINQGLKTMGYGITTRDEKQVTYKLDPVSEGVALTQEKDVREMIYDYLISKSVSDKEKSLTKIANKLESWKDRDAYLNQCRHFVQLLRHPDEMKDDYPWFYESKDYESNLDKLFKIFVSMFAYKEAEEPLKEFQSQTKSLRKEKANEKS